MRWTPAEFLEQAKKITHPMNLDKSLRPLLRDTLFDNLTRDPLELAKSRIQAVVTIKQMAQELEEKENSFKATLDPIIATVLKPKRILLWRTLLMAAEYDDIAIVDLISGGVPLTRRLAGIGQLEAQGTSFQEEGPADKGAGRPQGSVRLGGPER